MARPAEQRLHEVLDEMSHIGAVLPGSISERTTRCQRQGCHCRGDPVVLHGPYATWTWRPAVRPSPGPSPPTSQHVYALIRKLTGASSNL